MPGARRPRGHNRLTGQDSNLCRVKLEKLDFWMLLEHDFCPAKDSFGHGEPP
jgi:hypothetical protein